MLQLRVEIRRKRPFRRPIQHAPDRGAAIAVFRGRAERIAGLKGEVLLHAVHGREVVVLDLAQLQEAKRTVLVGVLWKVIGGVRGGGGGNVLFAELGRVLCEEVDDDVAGGRFEEDAHDFGVRRLQLALYFVAATSHEFWADLVLWYIRVGSCC